VLIYKDRQIFKFGFKTEKINQNIKIWLGVKSEM